MFSKGYVGMLWNSFSLFAFHTLQSAPINGFFSEATGRIHLCTFGECFFNLFVEFIDFFLILNSLPFPVNVYICFFSQYLFNAMWLRQFHITHGRCEFTRNYLNILLIKKTTKTASDVVVVMMRKMRPGELRQVRFYDISNFIARAKEMQYWISTSLNRVLTLYIYAKDISIVCIHKKITKIVS